MDDSVKKLVGDLTRLAGEREEQWQDIASAPKDGTHVMVAFGPYNQWTTFMQRPPTVAHWFGPPDLPGLRVGGWYLSVCPLDHDRIHPTHWRPLPAPPGENT